MGAAAQIEIRGEKGGSSKPKSPTEANDSLRSTNLAKMLIAVGEGEFDSVPTDYDIYLDNTPIKDVSGNINFPNVKWDWRSGSVDQSYIPGIPSVENETTLNIELRSDTPWVRSITNTQQSAARVRFAWPALQSRDDKGIGGYRIEYAIDVATDGGAYQQVLLEAVDGKTTTRYERSRRVDLPPATSGWLIRVRRLTANQNNNQVADTMLIAGLTEVIDAKLPVQVPCRAPDVTVPPWAAAGLRKSDSLEVKVRALLAERLQRIGYERELIAAHAACR